MTKPLLVLVTLFLSLSDRILAQPKWSVSVTAAPAYTFTDYNRRYLYPDSEGQIVEPVFLNGKMWASGYSAGLTVHYTYAPGWSVATGVWYRQSSISLVRLAAAGEGRTAVRSRTIRAPFLLNYRSSGKPLSPYFTFGLLVDFPLSSRVTAVRNGESTQQLRLGSDGGPVFLPMLGAGVQYQLRSRYALTVQPVWAYNLGRFGGYSTYNSSFELSLLTQVTYTF